MSPEGLSFVGQVKEQNSLVSIQRLVLDEQLVMAAQRVGAHMQHGTLVKVSAPLICQTLTP